MDILSYGEPYRGNVPEPGTLLGFRFAETFELGLAVQSDTKRLILSLSYFEKQEGPFIFPPHPTEFYYVFKGFTIVPELSIGKKMENSYIHSYRIGTIFQFKENTFAISAYSGTSPFLFRVDNGERFDKNPQFSMAFESWRIVPTDQQMQKLIPVLLSFPENCTKKTS